MNVAVMSWYDVRIPQWPITFLRGALLGDSVTYAVRSGSNAKPELRGITPRMNEAALGHKMGCPVLEVMIVCPSSGFV